MIQQPHSWAYIQTEPQLKWTYAGASLAVHWLRLLASIAEVMGSIPDWQTNIPQAEWYGLKKKKNCEVLYMWP